MHIVDLKSHTSAYINKRDRGPNAWDYEKMISSKLGTIIMKEYPAKHYAIVDPEGDAYEGVTAKQFKHDLGTAIISSMHPIVPFVNNGLRINRASVKMRAILLLDAKLTKGMINPSAYRRVLVICYDGVAYFEEVDTPEDVDAHIDKVCELTGCVRDSD